MIVMLVCTFMISSDVGDTEHRRPSFGKGCWSNVRISMACALPSARLSRSCLFVKGHDPAPLIFSRVTSLAFREVLKYTGFFPDQELNELLVRWDDRAAVPYRWRSCRFASCIGGIGPPPDRTRRIKLVFWKFSRFHHAFFKNPG
jgi:hypothetical protein